MSERVLPGHPARKKLDGIQVRIGALQAERKAIDRAPAALSDMKADALAKVRRFNDRHPYVDLDVASNPHELPSAPAERALAFFVAAIGDDAAADVIVKRRVAALKAAGREHGPTREQRAESFARIDAELVALYRTEELEVKRLEDAGHTIIRRSDIDGRLVVQVWYEQHAHDAAVAT